MFAYRWFEEKGLVTPADVGLVIGWVRADDESSGRLWYADVSFLPPCALSVDEVRAFAEMLLRGVDGPYRELEWSVADDQSEELAGSWAGSRASISGPSRARVRSTRPV